MQHKVLKIHEKWLFTKTRASKTPTIEGTMWQERLGRKPERAAKTPTLLHVPKWDEELVLLYHEHQCSCPTMGQQEPNRLSRMNTCTVVSEAGGCGCLFPHICQSAKNSQKHITSPKALLFPTWSEFSWPNLESIPLVSNCLENSSACKGQQR
jgi:hypothetical protein